MYGSIDYQCQVYESGYEIVAIDNFQSDKFEATSEIKSDRDYYVRPIDPNSPKRVFNLMDYPGAYFEFAILLSEAINKAQGKDVAPDFNDCIINYANKYGMLRNYSTSFIEDTDIWFAQVYKMSTAINSLILIAQGNTKELKTLYLREDNKFIHDNKSGIKSEPILDQIEIQTIGQTPPRNHSEAAYHYICMVVNDSLKDSLVTKIIANPTNTGTNMIVRPKDLLSALWLQLAHTNSRNLEYKQCAACSTFFEVKSKKRRFEKIYCSDRCRKRIGARRAREKAK